MAVPIRSQLDALTSIRFPAMLMIVIFHLWAVNGLGWAPLWVGELIGLGYVMVTFFFILSGFVLSYAYAGKEMKLHRFWFRRLARLYPLYFFSLLIAAPDFFHDVAVVSDEVPMLNWIGHHLGITVILVLAMCQAWVPFAAMAWNGPAWFVSALIFFYALFPFLLKRLKRLSSHGLIAVSVLAWFVAQGIAVTYEITSPDGMAKTDSTHFLFWLNALKFNPLVRLPEFIIGISFGIWFLRNSHRRVLATPLVLFGLTCILVIITVHHSIPYVVMHTGLLAPAFIAIILGLAYRPVWSIPLGKRPLLFLGKTSYALYLLHIPILVRCLFVDSKPPVATTPWHSLSAVGIAIAAAMLAYWVVERPSRKWLVGRSKLAAFVEQRM